MAKINISIPQPCHENWETMTPSDRGRFCASCQNNVIDFTKASDREIVTAFQQNNNLCGRFLNSQLNRDLVKTEKKNSVWLATVTAFISLFGLNEAVSQKKAPTEQTDNRALGKYIITETKPEEIEVSGVVSDKDDLVLPDVKINIKGKTISTQTDFDGKFKIKAAIKDTIVVTYSGFKTKEIIVEKKFSTKATKIEMELEKEEYDTVIIQGGIKKRTFLGRLLH